eukprot:9226025-Lingulodinium_polyedra.AAC.1
MPARAARDGAGKRARARVARCAFCVVHSAHRALVSPVRQPRNARVASASRVPRLSDFCCFSSGA